jgi:hypothetical protein
VNISLNLSSTFIPVEGQFKFICDSNCLRFRKSQFIKRSNHIIVTNYFFSKALILEKDTNGTYKVYKEVTNEDEIILIKKFVQGKNDFYYLQMRFYNEDNEEIRVVDPKYVTLLRSRVFHIKDGLYLSYLPNVFLILFDYEPKFAFINTTNIRSYDSTLLNKCPRVHIDKLDSIVFRQLKIKLSIIKELAKLESLNKMKEYIVRELSFNLI